MPHIHPPLPWLRSFESAARHGSFTLAAAEMGLTPAAVSHQVRALEAHLGYPLFLRKSRALTLTEMGALYLPWIARAFADLDRATTEVFGRATPRAVRLRCLPTLAQLWLVPRLGAWIAANPDLQLILHAGSWAGAMDPGALDLDIRYGEPAPGEGRDLGRAEPLARPGLLPVAAPGLLPAPVSRAALAERPLIDILGVADSWDSYLPCPAPPPLVRVDQSITALELATQGAGVALVWDLFAAPYLADGRLCVAVREPAPTASLGLWLVTAPDAVPRAEVARVRDWIVAALS